MCCKNTGRLPVKGSASRTLVKPFGPSLQDVQHPSNACCSSVRAELVGKTCRFASLVRFSATPIGRKFCCRVESTIQRYQRPRLLAGQHGRDSLHTLAIIPERGENESHHVTTVSTRPATGESRRERMATFWKTRAAYSLQPTKRLAGRKRELATTPSPHRDATHRCCDDLAPGLGVQ